MYSKLDLELFIQTVVTSMMFVWPLLAVPSVKVHALPYRLPKVPTISFLDEASVLTFNSIQPI